MRCRLPLLLAALLLCVFAANAQSTVNVFVSQMDGWRAHLGDNPAWASPAFDDSSWTPVSLQFATFPRELLTGRSRWFRKRIHLPDQPGPLDLILSGVAGADEVYMDGRRVSPPMQSSLRWRFATFTFPLREPANPGLREVEVAVRSHLYDQPFVEPGPPSNLGVGSPALVAGMVRTIQGSLIASRCVILGIDCITLIAALPLLTLFLQQRSHREYLWLGLCLLAYGMSNTLYAGQTFLPISWNGLFGDPCEYWAFAAEFLFVYAFVGREAPRAVRIYAWALFALPFFLNPVAWFHGMPASIYGAIENGAILPALVLPVAMLIVWARRGNREAALLIGPMFLANVGTFTIDVVVAMQYLHPSWPGIPAFHLGLVVIDYVSVTQGLFLLAVGLVIFLRFVRVSQEQVKTQAELEAARAVQNVLIPAALPSIPGFRIDSVYHPAQQVGGDFFQIIALRTGGVLAAVGDVSGKGMPAALTVALVVGTLRTLAEITSSPAEILSGLNRRLEGRSAGFTTCLAVRILPSGEATLASAGHLNPYVSSPHAEPREIPIAPGLPLGLAAEAAYTDVPISLAPGETLTFLSDGVVEARNARGELFGFDRACALAAHPAGEIARSAEEFGQDDDITVVTLTMTGATVMA